MNVGAKAATGNILYFFIVIVYRHFDRIIDDTVQNGNQAGCFRMKFDYRHPVLMISQWFTRFNPFPPAGINRFIITNYLKNSKDLMRISSFMRTMKLFLGFIKKQFVVIPDYIITSARRYHQNGIWRLQYHFSIIHLNED
jgi:hypothetical protein